MLTFDAEKHHYFWHGKRVPNVTSIIAALTDYSMVPAYDLELARQKGNAVHKMVELHSTGKLDLPTLPAWLHPVLTAWEKVSAELGITVLASERRVYHQTFRYAGTLDLRATIRAREGHGIIDLKRSFLAGRVIGLQTAAYAVADDASGEWDQSVTWRAALELREDKPPRFKFYDDKNDFNVFLAQLTTYNWKGELKWAA